MTTLYEAHDPSDEAVKAETLRYLDDFRVKIVEGKVGAYVLSWLADDHRTNDCSALGDQIDGLKMVASVAHNALHCVCGMGEVCEIDLLRASIIQTVQNMIGANLNDPGKAGAH